MRDKIITLLIGIYFGIVLVKGQVASWDQIHAMFRFESPYMYLVIASAIAVGVLSVFLIRRTGARTLDGQPVEIKQKPFQPGTIAGGTLFGMGWAVTGACPGPIYAQIGSGALLAVVTFLGALSGMYLYAFLQPRLPDTTRGFGASTGGAGPAS